MTLTRIAEVINDMSNSIEQIKDHISSEEYTELINNVVATIVPYLIKTSAEGKVKSKYYNINGPEFTQFISSFALKESPLSHAISYYIPEIDKELYTTVNADAANINNSEHAKMIDLVNNYRDYATIKKIQALLNSITSEGSKYDLSKLKNVSFLLRDNADLITDTSESESK